MIALYVLFTGNGRTHTTILLWDTVYFYDIFVTFC